MKKSLYGERDYAFGQVMLTLRTHIGLTQAGLGERPRRSVRCGTPRIRSCSWMKPGSRRCLAGRVLR